MAGPHDITIQVWSAFTMDGVVDKHGKPLPRWGDRQVKENVVVGATATIIVDKERNQTRISEGGTNADGKTIINIGDLESRWTGEDRLLPFILRLTPKREELSPCPAGPKLNPAAGGSVPARMYRPLEIELYIRDGKLIGPYDQRVVPGMNHGRVLEWSADKIVVDWKPDWIRSPNRDSRQKKPGINAIVLHRTDHATIGTTLFEFLNDRVRPEDQKSAHYIVDVDGFVVKLVADSEQAWHAGKGATWRQVYLPSREEVSVNGFAIGIEMVNKFADGQGTPYPKVQIEALIQLLKQLQLEFDIRRQRVLGHGEVKPLAADADLPNDRLYCPGVEFDWPLLESYGLAATPYPATYQKRPYEVFFDKYPDEVFVIGNKDAERRYGRAQKMYKAGNWSGLIDRIQQDLFEIGYSPYSTDDVEHPQHLPVNHGIYDWRTLRTVQRFQARYFSGDRRRHGSVKDPETGQFDKATANMLAAVYRDIGRP